VLGLDRTGERTGAERDRVETAFCESERHPRRRADGLLFTMGYSKSYFERFEADLTPGVRVSNPETVAKTLDHDTVRVGAPEVVDVGAGVRPTMHFIRSDRPVPLFDSDEPDVEPDERLILIIVIIFSSTSIERRVRALQTRSISTRR
jgi:hypothetical protein